MSVPDEVTHSTHHFSSSANSVIFAGDDDLVVAYRVGDQNFLHLT